MNLELNNYELLCREIEARIQEGDTITPKNIEKIRRMPKKRAKLLQELCDDFRVPYILSEFEVLNNRADEIRWRIRSIAGQLHDLAMEGEGSVGEGLLLVGSKAIDTEPIKGEIRQLNAELEQLQKELWNVEHTSISPENKIGGYMWEEEND